MSKAILFPKRRCRFSNSKMERASRYVLLEQNQKSSITCSRTAGRRMVNLMLRNLVEARRKAEKNWIVFGSGCKRMRTHVLGSNGVEPATQTAAVVAVAGGDL